ncbi:NifU family protein [bacterium]|nr:NifU family protein [bacterium]
MREKVEEVINSKIRPLLQADGGDIELVEVDGGVVKVRLTGACHGCPMAAMTLERGVERLLKENIAELERVVAV